MSGHSHWATIKRKKEKVDSQKGKVFTKIIREITVAAREGGGDPAGNARLRLILEKAKASNMPADNVSRAIKKGTGELEGADYETIVYEGYGPEGVAIIAEAITDNKNRTVSDLRHAFSRLGGKLAETGSVGWMFLQKGIIVISGNNLTEDLILEKLIDFNIEDITAHEGSNEFSIQCAISDLDKVRQAAVASGFKVESADIEWVAKDPIEGVNPQSEERVFKLLEALEDLDDIKNVYSNLK
jgi:YebC/PmpR family DNA-binding regulatory protein